MVKKLNPSFVAYFATYLKDLLSKPPALITAEMFQEQVTAAANKYLNDNYGADPSTARSAIAQSTPEAECANAIKARRLHNIQPEPDKRISYYKTQAEISTETNTAAFEDVKIAHPEVTNWISKTNMLLYDETSNKMRQQPVPFNIETAVKCGNCWICDTDVMSYTGTSTQDHRTEINSPTKYWLSGTTPCGDCEHVSAIMASYIAGMLKSANFAKFYWASYYVACVECNRKKSNYIGVRLHATRGWEVDADGVEAILNAIFSKNTVKIHESEYNPIRNELTNKYNSMSFAEKEDFRASVRANITSGTQTWCKTANDNMQKATATTKHLKMAFNVSKIIVAITGHLKVITGPLEKKAKKRNAESKVVKVARPGPKSTGKRSRGGAPPPATPMEGQRPQTPIIGYNDTQDSDVETATQAPGEPLTRLVSNAEQTRAKTPTAGESDTEEPNSLSTEPEADEKKDVVMAHEEKADGDTDDTDDYIMHWNNLLDNDDEDDDDDDDDENGQEDDDENDETKKANKLETEKIILTYIGKIYGPRLFTQYQNDPAIFEELMANLSKSMTATLEPMPDIQPSQVASTSSQSSASGKTTIFEFDQKAEEKATMQTVTEPEAGASSTTIWRPTALKPNYVTPAKPQDSSMIKPESNTEKKIEPSSNNLMVKDIDDAADSDDAADTTRSKTPIVEDSDDAADIDDTQLKKRSRSNETEPKQFGSIYPTSGAALVGPEEGTQHDEDLGGSRLNKHHSKNKSPTHNQKNRTKRVSYIKHKQTRKNHHSRKTK